jgi:hypothetical protein
VAEAVASDTRRYFDAALAGLRVQADGGNAAIGGRHASREMFEGKLTGRRMDVGDPPWQWLEIAELTLRPDDFHEPSVWCELSYIYPLDAPPGGRL